MPSEEMLTELKARVAKADDAIKVAKAELRTAERAGVDVSAQTQRLDDVSAKVKRIKTAYGI